jgi:hypothetical protein
MGYIDESPAVPKEIRNKLKAIRKCIAEIDVSIARIEQCSNRSIDDDDVLREWSNCRNQIIATMHSIEHKIICEIVRSPHLICA